MTSLIASGAFLAYATSQACVTCIALLLQICLAIYAAAIEVLHQEAYRHHLIVGYSGVIFGWMALLSARKLLKPSDGANLFVLTRKAQEHWSSCLYFLCSDLPVGGAVCQQRYVTAMSQKHS